MDKLYKYFRELVDFQGFQSAGRFAFLFQVILSNVAVWYAWLFVCIWTRSMVDIPVGVYTTYGLANGVAFAGKYAQSTAEKLSGTSMDKSKKSMENGNENRSG